MTLPIEVLAALDRMCTPMAELYIPKETAMIDAANMDTIRAHLLAQDAEIERLQSGLAKHVNRVCELQSRLASADALLQDIKDWDVTRSLQPTREETLFAIPSGLRARIAARLKEAKG